MSKNNLPIKIILQKTDDIFSNSGGGKTKFFSEVTPQLQIDISNKFESLLEYYNDVFEENENIPAIGQKAFRLLCRNTEEVCSLRMSRNRNLSWNHRGI